MHMQPLARCTLLLWNMLLKHALRNSRETVSSRFFSLLIFPFILLDVDVSLFVAMRRRVHPWWMQISIRDSPSDWKSMKILSIRCNYLIISRFVSPDFILIVYCFRYCLLFMIQAIITCLTSNGMIIEWTDIYVARRSDFPLYQTRSSISRT